MALTKAEISRRWRERHPDRAKAAQKRYHNKYPGRRAEIWARHKVSAKFQHNQADRMRRYKYGIQPEEFDRLIIESGGYCMLCGRLAAPKGVRALVVDHDHKTNKIRGVICNVCNQTLGFLEGHELGLDWLRGALTYLGRLF